MMAVARRRTSAAPARPANRPATSSGPPTSTASKGRQKNRTPSTAPPAANHRSRWRPLPVTSSRAATQLEVEGEDVAEEQAALDDEQRARRQQQRGDRCGATVTGELARQRGDEDDARHGEQGEDGAHAARARAWPRARRAGNTGGKTIVRRSPTSPDIQGRKKRRVRR